MYSLLSLPCFLIDAHWAIDKFLPQKYCLPYLLVDFFGASDVAYMYYDEMGQSLFELLSGKAMCRLPRTNSAAIFSEDLASGVE